MEDREREARLVKEYYKAAKRQDKTRTQQWIADQVGVHQSRVAGWVNGTQRIPDYSLERLAEVLNFDPELVRPTLKREDGRTADEELQSLKLSELIRKLDREKRAQVIDFIGFILRTRH